MFPPLALHTSLYTDVASVTAGVLHFRHIRCTQKRTIHLVQCLVILLFLVQPETLKVRQLCRFFNQSTSRSSCSSNSSGADNTGNDW
ncbi:hypothetical protein ACET3Z_018678 [Daucus carota]